MQHPIIAGVDEAGRGPLAGPVIAAAVILDLSKPISGLADSKKLSAKKRQLLFTAIQENALAWSIGHAEVAEIDQLNILWATMLAMKRAIENLVLKPDKVLIDGNRCPDINIDCEAIIGGDATIAEISAASIIAKVSRDAEMLTFDKQFPVYGFAAHKGYPTKKHISALNEHGISPIHRKSFGPVKRIIQS